MSTQIPPPSSEEHAPLKHVPLWKRPAVAKAWAIGSDFLSAKNIMLAVMLVVIVAVGLSTGWDRALAESTKEKTVKHLGETFTAGPFDMAINAVEPATPCPFSTPQHPTCIRVLLTAVNTTDARIEDEAFGTHLLDDRMLVLVDAHGDPIPVATKKPDFTRAIDGLSQGAFQPGISDSYTATWAVPEGTKPCDLSVQVYDATWRKSSLDGHRFWALDDPLLLVPACKGN